MKLENQVCTEQQAIRLKELGIDQSGYYSYAHRVINSKPSFNGEMTEWEAEYSEDAELIETSLAHFDGLPHVSAFTITEMGAMIGKGTNASSLLYDAVQARMNQSHSFTICYSPQFLANCVIDLLENNLITPAEVNARLANS
jgi:hypothetical protein